MEKKPEKSTRQQEQAQAKETLLSHLLALRKVLFVSAGALGISFLVIFYTCVDWLMGLITGPIKARGIEIIYTAMSEALMTKLKVALIAAAIISSPVIIWQLWNFIKPALYDDEKKLFSGLFFVAVFLFLLGVTFCYFAVYFLAVDFFLVAGENLATPMLGIDSYVGFLFGFIVPFGVAFLLPVALYITTRMGWTNAQMLAQKRKFVILGIAVFAAVLTPPDVVSQCMLAIPMLLLYEVSILVAKITKPRTRPEDM
ncbi:MAG: twin-arginine translocase subunit TatC [Clostridia bacterium]|nr:twin-arginine translocase subunit TatC [Clostridia bacterium]